MSVIGVRGMPSKITLERLIRNLAAVLKYQFEAFNAPRKMSIKTYYLKLPQQLDPFEIINVINGAKFPYKLEAFMPSADTNIKVPIKTKKIPRTLRKALGIPLPISSKELIQKTHQQIMIEMLSKFTQLYELSETTNHQLLLILWQLFYQRLDDIQTTTPAESGFILSKYYRKKYLHTTDFELIRDVLIKIQKDKRLDFQEIYEKELCSYNQDGNDVGDLSILGNDTIDTITKEYSDKIVSKVMEQIQLFNKDIHPDNQEDLKRAEVRQHIHNMAYCIPTIVRKIIRNKLITTTFSDAFQVVRIYGEPFLPNINVMSPFLKKSGYTSIKRSDAIFNLITIKIPIANYSNLLKCDGTVVSGARLVIRPLMMKTHTAQLEEIRTMKPETNIDVQEYCE